MTISSAYNIDLFIRGKSPGECPDTVNYKSSQDAFETIIAQGA